MKRPILFFVVYSIFTFTLSSAWAQTPTIQASSISFSNSLSTSVTVSWAEGNGSARLVLVKAGSPVDSDPIDGTSYIANSNFGSGAQLGTGNYVVYNGAGNSFTMTGIISSTNYHVKVYEYNGSAGFELYNISSSSGNPSQSITNGVSTGDYDALVALYNATDGPNWNDNTNWLTANPVSSWFGISTNLERVTDVDLRNNNLNGTLPQAIGNLNALVSLELMLNQIAGSIPPEIGSMTSLTLFDIDFNDFTGQIPSTIGTLINLEDFDINHNQISGPIPTEIGNLTQLKRIDFNNNLLDGVIPIEMQNLINLETLIINNNRLTGSLPPELGNLINVTNFDFHNNLLTGTLPSTLGNLVQATKIHLQDNQFTGAVPATFSNLTLMQDLGLHRNQLEDLPDLTAMTATTSVRLESNSFEFDDLEPNSGLAGVVYSPQANLVAPVDQSIVEGDPINLSIIVGGSANQYQWAKDGIDITGATASSISIASATLADAGTYHLKVTSSLVPGLTLQSENTIVTVSQVMPPSTPPSNQPPIILASSTVTQVRGIASVDLLTLVSDPDGNIDVNSFAIVQPPPSGAVASIDGTTLTVDYSATGFAGQDVVRFEACDFAAACTQQDVTILVEGDITLFDGISPNGDGFNDFFNIENIQILEPENKVSIFNRWGDKVYDVDNYDSSNPGKRFNGRSDSGKALPSGVYFYKVEFASGREPLSGYLTLKK